MSGRVPPIPFDPDTFGIRSFMDGNGRLFVEKLTFAMRLPKGGAKWSSAAVLHAPYPASGAPFVVSDELGLFPA